MIPESLLAGLGWQERGGLGRERPPVLWIPGGCMVLGFLQSVQQQCVECLWGQHCGALVVNKVDSSPSISQALT